VAVRTAGSETPSGLAFALVDVDTLTGVLSNFRYQNLEAFDVTVGFTNRSGAITLLPPTLVIPGTALKITPILQAPLPNDDFGTYLSIG
jgi:hypothetical protein